MKSNLKSFFSNGFQCLFWEIWCSNLKNDVLGHNFIIVYFKFRENDYIIVLVCKFFADNLKFTSFFLIVRSRLIDQI